MDCSSSSSDDEGYSTLEIKTVGDLRNDAIYPIREIKSVTEDLNEVICYDEENQVDFKIFVPKRFSGWLSTMTHQDINIIFHDRIQTPSLLRS